MHNNPEDYLFVLKEFNQLSLQELYQVLRLRNEVFVVEQNCPYQDLDNKDEKAHHVLIYLGEELVAYSRLFPPHVTFNEASIGRIITSGKVRSSGVGKILMDYSIESLYSLFGKQPIRIGAQCYAIPFYKKSGFEPEGDIYLEDGIEHIEMVKS
mgnify:CR=1 FL=1